MRLLIYSETSTVQLLKCGNVLVLSSHTFLWMWLLISMLGVKLIRVSKRGPKIRSSIFFNICCFFQMVSREQSNSWFNYTPNKHNKTMCIIHLMGYTVCRIYGLLWWGATCAAILFCWTGRVACKRSPVVENIDANPLVCKSACLLTLVLLQVLL